MGKDSNRFLFQTKFFSLIPASFHEGGLEVIRLWQFWFAELGSTGSESAQLCTICEIRNMYGHIRLSLWLVFSQATIIALLAHRFLAAY